MLYLFCLMLPAPIGADSPAFAEDKLCWLLFAAITLFDVYLLFLVLRLRRQWAVEDARMRAWEASDRKTYPVGYAGHPYPTQA